MSPPRVLVPISDGSEEIEAVCIVDTLRRAGVEVTVARVPSPGGEGPEVTASRGVRLVADALLDECAVTAWDAVVLPGGLPGAEYLRDSEPLTELLRTHADAGRLLGAICAAPVTVLAEHGLLDGRRATCFPALAEWLPAGSHCDERVVVDGPLVTSQGPGTALEFAIVLVGILCGDDKRAEIASQLLLDATP
ncbi:MAG: DJ-1/PfpI family protein [bacterium]|nr:DJ-1/PfpI family protein [bacterium]